MTCLSLRARPSAPENKPGWREAAHTFRRAAAIATTDEQQGQHRCGHSTHATAHANRQVTQRPDYHRTEHRPTFNKYSLHWRNPLFFWYAMGPRVKCLVAAVASGWSKCWYDHHGSTPLGSRPWHESEVVSFASEGIGSAREAERWRQQTESNFSSWQIEHMANEGDVHTTIIRGTGQSRAESAETGSCGWVEEGARRITIRATATSLQVVFAGDYDSSNVTFQFAREHRGEVPAQQGAQAAATSQLGLVGKANEPEPHGVTVGQIQAGSTIPISKVEPPGPTGLAMASSTVAQGYDEPAAGIGINQTQIQASPQPQQLAAGQTQQSAPMAQTNLQIQMMPPLVDCMEPRNINAVNVDSVGAQTLAVAEDIPMAIAPAAQAQQTNHATHTGQAGLTVPIPAGDRKEAGSNSETNPVHAVGFGSIGSTRPKQMFGLQAAPADAPPPEQQ